MKLTKDEKEKLFELLDYATDNFPKVNLLKMASEDYHRVFYKIFLKLRLELKGF